MTDMTEYETKLRAKIDETEKQVESAVRTIAESDDWPTSNAYRQGMQLAVLLQGQWMGLLMALGELTGNVDFEEPTRKFQEWLQRRS